MLLEVKKTTDFTSDSMQVLKDGLLEVSKGSNVAQTELARIAALGGQMGVGEQGPEALVAFTEELSRAVTALDVSADLAAPAMGKLVNIFNLPLGEFRNAVAVINQLSNVSTATAEEILDVMRRIGDLGGSSTFSQSAALSALAIDIGLTAETAGTTITKIFADMKSEAAAFASFMGMSTQEWVDIVGNDAVTGLTLFLQQLNRLPAEVAAQSKVELTGGGRIFEFVTKMQNQLRQGDGSRMATLLREANEEWVLGTSAIKEQQNVLSGTIAQWEIFRNRVNTTLIAGGDEALRGINDLLASLGDTLSAPEFVEGFATFVSNATEVTRAILTMMGSVSSVLGGSGIEWSSVFNIAGLLVAIGIMKTIPALMGLVGRAVTGARNTPSSAGGGAEEQQIATQRTLRQRIEERARAAVDGYSREQQAIAATSTRRNADAEIARRQGELARTQATAAAEHNVLLTTLERNKVALRYESLQATARAGQIEAAWNARLATLQQARVVAEQRLAAAIAARDTVSERSARAELARVGRQAGGVNSSYAQQLQRERQQSQAILAGMRNDYGRTLEDIRTLRLTTGTRTSILSGEIESFQRDRERLLAEVAALQTQTSRSRLFTGMESAGRVMMTGLIGTVTAGMRVINAVSLQSFANMQTSGTSTFRSIATQATAMSVAVRNAFASMAGIAIPAGASLGFVGNAAVVASGGIAALARGAILLRAGLTGLMTLVSRLFYLFILIDIAKMALQFLGVMDDVEALVDSVIGKFNKLTGLKIPKFSDARESAAEARQLEQQIRNRERLYAQAEAFGKRFGEIRPVADIEQEPFNTGLTDMAKRLDTFIATIEKGIQFGGSDELVPAEAFLQGADAIRTIEQQITALTERQRELNEEQQRSSQTATYDPLALAQLERAAAINALEVDQQKELERLQKAKAADEKEYIARQQESRVLDQQRFELMVAQDRLTKAILSGLGQTANQDLFGTDQLLARLINAKQVLDSINQARGATQQEANTEGATGPVSTATLERLKELNTRSNEAKAVFENLTAEVAGTDTMVQAFGRNARNVTQQLASAPNADALFAGIRRNSALAGDSLSVFTRGLAAVNTSLDEQSRLAARYAFGTQMAAAYKLWAQNASAAAEQAKNAINQAVSQNQRDLDDLVKSAVEADQRIRQNQNTADLQVSGRKLDAATERKLFDLDLERQKKLDIIQLDAEYGRLSDEQAKRREFAIKQEFDKRAQAIRDVAEVQRTASEKDSLFIQFEQSRAAAVKLQEQMRFINEAMNDTGRSQSEKDGFLSQQSRTAAELEAQLQSMGRLLQSLASIEPVGGKMLISVEELRPLQEELAKLTAASGGLRLDGLTSARQQLESLASNLDTGRAAMDLMVKTSVEGLQKIAQATNTEMPVIARNIAAAFSDPAIQQAITDMQATLNAGLVDVGGIRYSAEQARTDAENFAALWKEAAGSISLTAPAIAYPENLPQEARSFISKLQKDLAIPITLNIPPVIETPTTPRVSADVAIDPDQIQKAIDAGNYKIDAEINATGASNVIVPQNNADGGYIRGAGTGRSDSILSWLSHREYVVDARTVRMFGPGFFKFLQSVAKSGVNVLSAIPAFMDGGMLGSRIPRTPSVLASAIPSVQNIFNLGEGGGSRDVIDLNLSVNGKPRSRVSGSREQVDMLVEAIQELRRV
jgi:TP901 family phage tail tape measure protein